MSNQKNRQQRPPPPSKGKTKALIAEQKNLEDAEFLEEEERDKELDQELEEANSSLQDGSALLSLSAFDHAVSRDMGEIEPGVHLFNCARLPLRNGGQGVTGEIGRLLMSLENLPSDAFCEKIPFRPIQPPLKVANFLVPIPYSDAAELRPDGYGVYGRCQYRKTDVTIASRPLVVRRIEQKHKLANFQFMKRVIYVTEPDKHEAICSHAFVNYEWAPDVEPFEIIPRAHGNARRPEKLHQNFLTSRKSMRRQLKEDIQDMTVEQVLTKYTRKAMESDLGHPALETPRDRNAVYNAMYEVKKEKSTSNRSAGGADTDSPSISLCDLPTTYRSQPTIRRRTTAPPGSGGLFRRTTGSYEITRRGFANEELERMVLLAKHKKYNKECEKLDLEIEKLKYEVTREREDYEIRMANQPIYVQDGQIETAAGEEIIN